MRDRVAFLLPASILLLLALLLPAGKQPGLAAISETVTYATAEEAILAAARLYEAQVAPPQQLAIGAVHQDENWGYAIAQAAETHTVIPVLARHDGDGWQATAPGLLPADEFNAWLAAVPESLMDGALKAYLQIYDPARAPLAYFSGHLLPWPGGRTGVVTYKDGYSHYGQIDFAIERDVYASKPGRVVFVKESSPDPDEPCSDFEACWRKANMVVVQHGPAEYSWYVHLAYNSVPDDIWVNKEILAGVKIGVEGRTGYTYGETGYHLHFMVSTGHYAWTDPNDPDALPWATGIEQTDFIERRWDELIPDERYLSINYATDSPARSSVDGLALDRFGRPAAGAAVVLLPGAASGAVRTAHADGLGTYKFQEVVEGSYVAGAGRDGFWQMITAPVSDSDGVNLAALTLSRACGSASTAYPEREIEALVCDDTAVTAPLDEPAAPAVVTAAAPLVLTAEPGVNNVALRWEATNSIEVSQYRLLRRLGDSTTFAALASTPETFYVDTSTIAAGSQVCYQVQARRASGTIVANSNVDCTVGQAVSLWVPHVEARPGERIRIPVNIRNARGLELDAATIVLDYDPRVLALWSVAPGTLAGAYDWYTSVSGDSVSAQVRVSSVPSESPTLYGSGALFWLTFDVRQSSVISSTLDLREYASGSGSTIFTPSNPTQPVPLILLDGTFYVEPERAYGSGDVNGDGAISAADGTAAVRIASNRQAATARQLRAAEVTGDGRVDGADGSAILAYASMESWPTAPSTPATPATPAIVSIDAASGILGETVETTLRISDGGSWAGGVFWLAYDPARVAGVVTATPVGIAAGAQAAVYDNGTGLARIVVSSAAPLAADGAFVEIGVRVGSVVPSGTITPLVLVAATLHDAAGQDYTTSALQVPITRQSSTLAVDYLAAFLPAVRR